MKVKHILVPMDFSPCAINALRVAVRLARGWDGKLFIAHALQIPESYMSIAGTYTPVGLESIHAEVSHSFESLSAQVPELKQVDHETHELSQDLLEGLFTLVQSRQIDMIVMGTRAHHDRLERIIGTHAAEVIESIHIPVLVIPGNVTDLTIRRIGFATDAKPIINTSRLGYIARFAEFFDAGIEVFFVAKPEEGIDFKQSNIKKVMDRYFQSVRHDYVNVHSEKALKGIIDHIRGNQLDALVLIPRYHDLLHKWLHGSTTRYMVQNLQKPMLALPE